MDNTVNRAVFLDRDGVINDDIGYVHTPENFKFIDGIFELCRTAQNAGFLLVVVTNQAGIARGYYSEEDFRILNKWMLAGFKQRGINIAAVYYCPFHPEYGTGMYRQDSFDRKPNPGMILRARDELGIDLSRSVLIGDKDSDAEAGRNAGVGRLILIRGKYQLKKADDVEVYDSLLGIEANFC